MMKSVRKLSQSCYFITSSSAKQTLDPPELLESKLSTLVSLLHNAKYPIIFTGAGISTSIDIPDYRSGLQTIIKTGPGMWNRHPNTPPLYHPIDKLIDQVTPSLSHMAIKTLLSQGIIKHLISQNTDGLHLRTGINPINISQLHGNRNLEYCINGGQKYLRDFRTLTRTIGVNYKPGQKRSHKTERSCENCGGELHDSIVYFGQKLPKQELDKAVYQANLADLCVCLGSSLTVQPSSNIPRILLQKGQRGHLAIVNIQETPLDGQALKINYFCDEFMGKMMDKLGIEIEKYVVEHRLVVWKEDESVIIQGRDRKGRKVTLVQRVRIEGRQDQGKEAVGCRVKLNVGRHEGQVILVEHFGGKPVLRLNIAELGITNTPQEYKFILQAGQWNLFQ